MMAMMAVVGFGACSDNDDEEEDITTAVEATYEEAEDLPTEDQLTTTTDVSTAVLSSSYSNVAQALVNRLKNHTTEITASTEAILISATDFISIIQDSTTTAYSSLVNAYDNNVLILVDQVTKAQLEAIDDFTGWQHSNDADEEHEEHICYELYGFNVLQDQYYQVNICDDDSVTHSYASYRADTDSTSTYTIIPHSCSEWGFDFTAYLYGLYADPAAAWITENAASNTSASAARAVKLANAASNIKAASNDMSAIIKGQNITETVNYSVCRAVLNEIFPTSTTLKETLAKQKVPYTITTSIYAAYSFTDDMDYYLVNQTIVGNGSNIWLKRWEGKYDGMVQNWQGMRLDSIDIQSRLVTGNKNEFITRDMGCYLAAFSPENSNGSTTQTSTVSWNLTGNIGTGGGSFGGGVTGTVGESRTIRDLTTRARVADNNDTGNNARWQYAITQSIYSKNVWGKYSFKEPCALSIDALQLIQSWLWKVENPSQYSNIKLRMDTRISYKADHYRNKTFKTYYGWILSRTTARSIKTINTPIRTMQSTD